MNSLIKQVEQLMDDSIPIMAVINWSKEVSELEAENERLRGEWEKEEHRCPQCGTGNPRLVALETEVEGWKSAFRLDGERARKAEAQVARLTAEKSEMECVMDEMAHSLHHALSAMEALDA